jgi:DNA-binding transcriptional LysR family regulator
MANRFEQMRAFAGVVESGGFTSATARTGMSRAVVSRNIIELEERLGARLLNRTTRQVSLTDAGRLFYEKCRRILDELEEAELAAAENNAGPRGELRVVAPVNFGLNNLGPAIVEFLATYEHLRIDLSLNDRLVDPIESGFDIAIRVQQSEPQLPMHLDACVLARSSRILCASPAYLAASGEPASPGDLAGHPCLSYSYVEDPGLWRFTRGQEKLAVRVNSRITTSAGSILATGAARGLGIAYGPLAFFQDRIEIGELRQVLADFQLPQVTIFSFFARSRHQPPKVEAFNAFMRENLYPIQPSGAAYSPSQ